MKKVRKTYKVAIVLACTCLFFCGVLHSVGASDNGKEFELNQSEVNEVVTAFGETLNISADELKREALLQEKATGDGHTYFDKEGNMFRVSEDGVVESFLIASYDSNDKVFIADDVAVEISKKCLSLVAKADKYAVKKVAFYDDMDYYRVELCYCIGEYETSDQMYFEVASDGKIIGYNAVDTGKYEGIAIETKDKDSLVKEAMDIIKKNNYDCGDFELGGVMILLQDNSVYYNVSATCVDMKTGEFKVVSTTVY